MKKSNVAVDRPTVPDFLVIVPKTTKAAPRMVQRPKMEKVRKKVLIKCMKTLVSNVGRKGVSW